MKGLSLYKNIVKYTFTFVISLTFIILGTQSSFVDSVNVEGRDAIESEKLSIPKVVKVAEKIHRSSNGNIKYLIGYGNNEEILGYIFKTAANADGGPLYVSTGITSDFEILGINVYAHNENQKNVSMIIENKDFLQQFKDKKIPTNKSTGKKYIKAVSKKTNTDDAILNAINDAIDLFSQINPSDDKYLNQASYSTIKTGDNFMIIVILVAFLMVISATIILKILRRYDKI